MLKSKLFGRARNLCTGFDDTDIDSAQGVEAIIGALLQLDALTVFSEVFCNFNELISTRRSNAESYRSFENRFAAQVAKLNSYGT